MHPPRRTGFDIDRHDKLQILIAVPLVPVFLLGLLALAIDAACAFRAEEMPSLISCRMAAKVMAGVQMSDVLLGRHSIKQKISHTLRGYGMIHEDGDNDAIGGNDDERAISWNNKVRNGIAFINNLPSYCT
ncbi:hypothetical protein Tco_0598975 [Tanacetum coccineum]